MSCPLKIYCRDRWSDSLERYVNGVTFSRCSWLFRNHAQQQFATAHQCSAIRCVGRLVIGAARIYTRYFWRDLMPTSLPNRSRIETQSDDSEAGWHALLRFYGSAGLAALLLLAIERQIGMLDGLSVANPYATRLAFNFATTESTRFGPHPCHSRNKAGGLPVADAGVAMPTPTAVILPAHDTGSIAENAFAVLRSRLALWTVVEILSLTILARLVTPASFYVNSP